MQKNVCMTFAESSTIDAGCYKKVDLLKKVHLFCCCANNNNFTSDSRVAEFYTLPSVWSEKGNANFSWTKVFFQLEIVLYTMLDLETNLKILNLYYPVGHQIFGLKNSNRLLLSGSPSLSHPLFHANCVESQCTYIFVAYIYILYLKF
jgi:hypothetical protein